MRVICKAFLVELFILLWWCELFDDNEPVYLWTKLVGYLYRRCQGRYGVLAERVSSANFQGK